MFDHDENSVEMAKLVQSRVPTLKERLDMGVAEAEQNLRKAKRAREILDKNPDLEELINLMNSTPGIFRF